MWFSTVYFIEVFLVCDDAGLTENRLPAEKPLWGNLFALKSFYALLG